MDKDQIRAELDARGITYNARLGVEKLQIILDEAIAAESGATGPTAPTGETGVTGDGETGATAPTAEEEGPTGPTAPVPSEEREVDESKIAVLDKHGLVARVFTLEEHGDGFVDLAQEFAKKRGLRISEMYKR